MIPIIGVQIPSHERAIREFLAGKNRNLDPSKLHLEDLTKIEVQEVTTFGRILPAANRRDFHRHTGLPDISIVLAPTQPKLIAKGDYKASYCLYHELCHVDDFTRRAQFLKQWNARRPLPTPATKAQHAAMPPAAKTLQERTTWADFAFSEYYVHRLTALQFSRMEPIEKYVARALATLPWSQLGHASPINFGRMTHVGKAMETIARSLGLYDGMQRAPSPIFDSLPASIRPVASDLHDELRRLFEGGDDIWKTPDALATIESLMDPI